MSFRSALVAPWLLVTLACGSETANPVVASGGEAGRGGQSVGGSSSGAAGTNASGSSAAGTGGGGGAVAGMGGSVGGSGGVPPGGTGGGSGGGAGGAAGGPAVDGCGDGAWTCLPVPGDAPYGTQTFDVPARQNWVNTGVYLRQGEVATITESGSWQLDDTGDGIDHGSCKVGDLVARTGLNYKDSALTCVNGSAQFKATRDGILFVGALAGNDLGETYETRATASGKKSVTVTSTAATVPTVLGSGAASYDFGAVASGWVEVWGEHVILTLPVASAKKDAAVLARATARLDAIYELEAELRGALPHSGQRLRFFPDGTQPGYMLAGNPVRMQLALVNGGDTTRISRAGESGTDIWGFAHEMGHDFSFAPHGFWTYEENTLESWCNVFAIYALESLKLPLHERTMDCSESSTGSYDSWDAWGGLCFLRQFQFRYGWGFYERYFSQIKDTKSTGGGAWTFVRKQFDTAANEDTSELFDAWDVPE